MSGQEGPVEPGRSPVVHMDLDAAARVLLIHESATDPAVTDAVIALRTLIDRARQYVAGPTSGRLAGLCQVLQEPVPDVGIIYGGPVNVQTVVQAYLTERRLVTISQELAAERLGITAPYA